jgi:hypothetical protein
MANRELTTLSRRAILAGASAIAATAALPASAAAIDPDAELLDLAARWPALDRIHSAAQERAELLLFEVQRNVWFPARIAVGGHRTMPRSVEDLKVRHGAHPRRLRSALRARATWEREVQHQLSLTEYPALKAEFDRLDREREALFERIMATRCKTPAGMLAKLDLYPEDTLPDDMTASVYADLRALAGVAGGES